MNELATALAFFPNGRKDFGDWTPDIDEQITDIDAIEIGDVLFSSNVMYRTLQLCRVTSKDAKRRQFHAVYCNPRNVLEACGPGGVMADEHDVRPTPELACPEDMLSFNKHWRAVKKSVCSKMGSHDPSNTAKSGLSYG